MKVQGTDLYYIDPEDGTLQTVECITSLDSIGSTRAANSISSCLSDTKAVASKIPGDLTPGTVSMGLNADPTIASHLRLHDLLSVTQDFDIAIGLGDGTRDSDDESLMPATLDSDGAFVLPTGRSWLVTKGFVAAFPWTITSGAVVTATVSVELTQPVTPIAKVAS